MSLSAGARNIVIGMASDPTGAIPVPLVVVLGASASFGAGEDWGPMRPPLTVDLFDEEQYGRLLAEYDPPIRPAVLSATDAQPTMR